jgi:CheY-like chemotaxis protein
VKEGSKFHFTVVLDLTKSESEPVTKEINKLIDLPILVVDDNASNRRILQEILTNWHMKPTLVNSGAEALNSLEKANLKDSFPLVLLDVHMPDMDGFALAEQIRNCYKHQGIKVILLTSAFRPSDVARCRELGISDYLNKPIKQSEVFDSIVTAMAEHSRKTERIDELKQIISEIEKTQNMRQSSEQNSFRAIGRLELLLDSVMGDRVLLAEMAELWLADSAKQERQVRNGLDSGDIIMVQRAAHALKGSIGTFQASAAQDAASQLEMAAKNADLVRARQAFETLLTQIDLVRQDLRQLCTGASSRRPKP